MFIAKAVRQSLDGCTNLPHMRNRYKFIAHLFISVKKFPEVPTYSNAHAKVKKLIFEVQFPRYLFDFGIILNDF